MSDQHTDGSNYGYTPSLGWCVAFVTLFSLSGLLHCFQAYRAKYWVVYCTLVLGSLTEVLGWSARVWSNRNVTLLTPFLMQISTLIIAPCFFSAWDYVVLGSAIKKLGPQYSLLRPSWYFIVFIIADLVSITIQAIGGGLASSSAATGTPTTSATDIMVAGIIFQLITMAAFMSLGFDFILRATSKRPYKFQERRLALQARKMQEKRGSTGTAGTVEMGVLTPESETTVTGDSQYNFAGGKQGEVVSKQNLNRWWIVLGVAMISSLMILIRGVYRSIELKQGWTGFLITHEIYQNCLDGIPMIIAVGIFNIAHPSYLLPKKTSWRNYHLSG